MATLNKWNDRYRAAQQTNADNVDRPNPLVMEFTQALTPGVALDLACGPGRNAIYLSDLGWRVTALDASPVALDLLLASTRGRNRSIDARLVDLEAPEFELPPEGFDLILCCYYLQRSLIPRIKAALRPGGVLIMIVLLARADQPQGTPTRACRDELRTFFPDWTIMHYREGETGEPGHQHICGRTGGNETVSWRVYGWNAGSTAGGWGTRWHGAPGLVPDRLPAGEY